jgi:thiol:disulfide interchange protein
MNKIWIWTFLMSALASSAQDKGFTFKHRWEEIIQKAKVEHKYIFVDCYASWCGPCKEMDRNVYSDDSLVGWMGEDTKANILYKLGNACA